jgi:hypothetical protein
MPLLGYSPGKRITQKRTEEEKEEKNKIKFFIAGIWLLKGSLF